MLFNIALEKAEHNFQYRKWKTAAEEVGVATLTLVAIRARPAITVSEDEFIDDIPTEVKALATQFARLPQEEIGKIFSNCFWRMNLYKLHLMKD